MANYDLLTIIENTMEQEHLTKQLDAFINRLPTGGATRKMVQALRKYYGVRSGYSDGRISKQDAEQQLKSISTSIQNVAVMLEKGNLVKSEANVVAFLYAKLLVSGSINQDLQLTLKSNHPSHTKSVALIRRLKEQNFIPAQGLNMPNDIEAQQKIFQAGAKQDYFPHKVALANVYLSHITGELVKTEPSAYTFLDPLNSLDKIEAVLQEALSSGNATGISQVANFVSNIASASMALFEVERSDNQKAALKKCITLAKKLSNDKKVNGFLTTVLTGSEKKLAKNSTEYTNLLKSRKEIAKYIANDYHTKFQLTNKQATAPIAPFVLNCSLEGLTRKIPKTILQQSYETLKNYVNNNNSVGFITELTKLHNKIPKYRNFIEAVINKILIAIGLQARTTTKQQVNRIASYVSSHKPMLFSARSKLQAQHNKKPAATIRPGSKQKLPAGKPTTPRKSTV